MVFYLQQENYSNKDILTIIGIFAIAAFRLLPLFSRLLLGFQDLKFYLPSVNHLYDEFVTLDQKISSNLFQNSNKNNKILNKLEIKDISYSYENNKKILDGLSQPLTKMIK